MNNDNNTLSYNEQVVFSLRSLFNKRGYTQYKMSKFEEYDLYAKNKDFLISDSIITFTDTNGKLMALKPDVTLSIIKNSKDEPDTIQKVYYDENVYRISKGTNTFKEITQIGLECFGNIDNYNICEVITLACKSLQKISPDAVLDISHLGIITEILDYLNIPSSAKSEVMRCISEKNSHELASLCSDLGLSYDDSQLLKTIATTYGTPDKVLNELYKLVSDKIGVKLIDELSKIINAVDSDVRDMIRFDFSVVSDTHYYNSIVFKGFVEGVPTSVLSGGQYDNLMQRIKRKSEAIGFAIYLDMLEILDKTKKEYDVDIVLQYDKDTNIENINNKVLALTNKGYSVFACSTIPSELKFKEVINIKDCEVD